MNAGVVLSIGSTHPWNIAGIGLDARVAAEYGLRHAAAIAGVTAQDEGGLKERFALPTEMLRAQLACVPRRDLRAIRVGAIFDTQNIFEVAHFLERKSEVPAIVDPVLDASLGGTFATAQTEAAFKSAILALPIILTPNLAEAERLTGGKIASTEDMVAAAGALLGLGPRAVLLKGGHLAEDPIDVLVTAEKTTVFKDPRIAKTMRGTGCTLAAALACELGTGRALEDAVAAARAYVRKKIEAQIPYASLHVAF